MISPVASIKVIGCGWAGQNTINRTWLERLSGVEFISINRQSSTLWFSGWDKNSLSDRRSLGLSAGGDPEKGKKAAEESIEDIRRMIQGADMVFVTCGLDGSTGSGSAQSSLKSQKIMGILVIGCRHKTICFRGQRRNNQALEAYDNLKSKVDTLITRMTVSSLSSIKTPAPRCISYRRWSPWQMVYRVSQISSLNLVSSTSTLPM